MTQPYPISPNDPVSPPQPARTDEPGRYPIHQPIPEGPIHPQPSTTPTPPAPPEPQSARRLTRGAAYDGFSGAGALPCAEMLLRGPFKFLVLTCASACGGRVVADDGLAVDASVDACAPLPCPSGRQWAPAACRCVLERCPMDEGETVLATVAAGDTGWTLAVHDGTVYFTALGGANNAGGVILAVDRCGGPVATVASGQVSPQALAVDDVNLYWGDQGGDNSGVSHGALIRQALDGGPLTVMSDAGVFTGQIASDGAFVYSTATAGYLGAWRAPLDGGPASVLFTSDTFVDAIVVDATNAYVSQATDIAASGHILRVPVAGGAATTLTPSNVDYPGVLAIDDANVYFQGASSLTRLPKNGSAPTVLAAASANGIATDGSHVYWVEGNATTSVPGALKRISTAGGAVDPLSHTSGLAVAVDDTYVYWINTAQVLRLPK